MNPNQRFCVCALTSAVVLSLILFLPAAKGRQSKLLRIGTSGYLTPADQSGTEKGAVDALRSLIQEKTGFEVQIERQNGWRQLAERIAKGQLELGIFHGYEFAWARNDHLKPLVLANSGNRYLVFSVMTRRDNPAKDLAGLQDRTVSIPDIGHRDLRLFIDRNCRALKKTPETFFSKVSVPHNVEDALDDVVDGQVQAIVVDQQVLEAYQRRKPGRFDQLKEVVRSQPFPPAVIAYDDRVLDEATVRQFRDGLLRGAGKDKQDIVLGLFHWKGFESVPADFDQVLAETRKVYPAPEPRNHRR
jgi:ABC-type phosphate/phosphonate transport system substrate-binding protein